MSADQAKNSAAANLIDTIDDAERASLDAVKKFVENVNDAFPEVGDDGPRRKIIDSAFKMTEQLVGASTRLAQNMLNATEQALNDDRRKSSTSSR